MLGNFRLSMSLLAEVLVLVLLSSLPTEADGRPKKGNPSLIFHMNRHCSLGFSLVGKWKHSVHPVVTNRDYAMVVGFLERGSALCKGVNGDIPTFSKTMQEILSGERSVLSLGEGNSDFIRELIKKAKRPDLIHAVDIIYQDVDAIPEGEGGIASSLKTFIKNSPGNYHGEPIQNFSILDKNGSPIQFDEIVSSHALSFLLKRENPMLLKSLISTHLKRGGTLRMIGCDNEMWQRLKPLLIKWKSGGLISNYSDLDQLTEINRFQLAIVR